MALPMLFQLLLDLAYALRPIITGKRRRSTGLRIGWDEKVEAAARREKNWKQAAVRIEWHGPLSGNYISVTLYLS